MSLAYLLGCLVALVHLALILNQLGLLLCLKAKAIVNLQDWNAPASNFRFANQLVVGGS